MSVLETPSVFHVVYSKPVVVEQNKTIAINFILSRLIKYSILMLVYGLIDTIFVFSLQ